MRIAVVQIELPIQSYTRDLINGLAAQGSELTLLTRPDDWPGYVDPKSVKAPVHLIETEWHRRLLREIRYATARRLGIETTISPEHSLLQAERHLDTRPPFDLVIGIEKAGLEIAARFAERAKTPFVYYSLELYVEDHPDLARFGWKRKSEIRSHRQASATIVQDPSRWNVLKSANRPVSDRVFFLPVGVPPLEDAPVRREADGAPKEVLYLGHIRESRFAGELVEAAASLPEAARLHLHGPISESFRRTLASRRLPENLSVTSDMLDEAGVNELVANAAIGLALYRRECANDRLTAFSSQKIAMYLRAGVPIITFASESYADLYSRHRCGEMIEDFGELPAAIEKILGQREAYSKAARQAFSAIYDADRYWAPLAKFLSELVEARS